jgi:ubiquinone/menaquinone biosynthesis C-methylase UbiE
MEQLLRDQNQIDRYHTMLEELRPLAHLFRDKTALDFGSSSGSSACALVTLGAGQVDGVEPVAASVREGLRIVNERGFDHQIFLQHLEDTSHLPFAAEQFDFVLAQAVFEHIPQPRDAYLRELWRVLKPGGHLLIAETPNKYWPKEIHTTDLWFNHWLPERMAYKRAVRAGRSGNGWPGEYKKPDNWPSSGWRGMGYFEMVRPLDNYVLIPERTRPRHRVFSALGIPASIIDPYPKWLLRKFA